MGGFRGFVPVVFPGLLGLFRGVSGFFGYGVLPAYLVWIEGYSVDVLREWLDGCGVEWVLSSVMPDELLDEDVHLRFLDLAWGLGVDWVLVWDLPTYLERREEGWRNIDRCVELVEFFEDRGFRVIPLVKGAYEDQVRYCVGRFKELGFDFVAFRATDYMRSLFPPYPELPDESSDPKYLLMKFLRVVFDEGVDKVLLLGGMNPKYIYEFWRISEDIVFSGVLGIWILGDILFMSLGIRGLWVIGFMNVHVLYVDMFPLGLGGGLTILLSTIFILI